MKIPQINRYILYFLAILNGHLTRKNAPIFVVLCVTNRCNLKCVYCYEEYYDRNHKEFTTAEVLDLIDELARMGTKYISINGGESLLRNDIDIIVNKIKEKNMLSHLSTNGLLIKKNIHILKKIDSLAISIDGARESNDLNRGAGTYDKIIEAIECLRKNNIKFHTHTVLTKNNKNAVDEVLSLASNYGFKAQFSPLRKEDSPNKKIGLDTEELKSIIRKIICYKKLGLPVFFSAEAYNNLLNWPFTYEKEIIYGNPPEFKKPNNCYIKRFHCHIEADGKVYPCVTLVNKFKALNFLETGFKKAWDNLARNECKACSNVCYNDHSLIFGLKPHSVLNAFKIVKDRIK